MMLLSMAIAVSIYGIYKQVSWRAADVIPSTTVHDYEFLR